MRIHAFHESPQLNRNPRFISLAWFSGNGIFVAWYLIGRSYQESRLSPSPVTVEDLDGSQIWRLPGSISEIGALGVSMDGRHVAFFGTYQPPGMANDRNHSGWTTGLQYGDSETNTITPIRKIAEQPGNVTSISWSPDSNAFAYDSDDRIYIYNIAAESRRFIAEGSAPAWSPDGTRLAFRSTQGNAVVINLEKNETPYYCAERRSNGVFTGRRIRGM